MPLTAHLEELRKRLLIAVVAYIIGVGLSFSFSTELFQLLKRPLNAILAKHPGSTLAIRSLAEGFMVDLKVALIAGLFVSSPIIIWQIWKFVSPGLYEHEKRLAIPVVVSATVLFTSGALFGYMVIFPMTFDFFLSFAGGDTAAVLSIDEYLDFAGKMLGGFGLIFELPLVIFVMARLGIVNHSQLKAVRRYVIVANFVIAAIITPPDVISQLGVALPLILLYEVGIGIAWMVGRQRRTDADVLAESKNAGNLAP